MPVLRVDSPDGKLRAVLFGAAVHNTTLTDTCYEVCGDYAGFAQTYVQEHHPGAQTLFMLGLAGDSNPYPRGTMELARHHGETLGKEVGRVLETKLQPVRGPLKITFGKADLPLQAPPPREELEKQAARKGPIQAWVAQQILAKLNRGEKLPTHYSCPVAVWQFGPDLTVVGLSGPHSMTIRLFSSNVFTATGAALAYWNPDEREQNRYGFLAHHVESAGGRVKGMLFFQGEQDAIFGDEAETLTKPTLIAPIATYGDQFIRFVECANGHGKPRQGRGTSGSFSHAKSGVGLPNRFRYSLQRLGRRPPGGVVERQTEPGAGVGPVVVRGRGRDAQRPGGLGVG